MKKILNVIGSLDIGGAEINAMNILRNIDRNKYQYEFLVFDQTPGAFEEEAITLGAKVIRMQEPKENYKQFLKEFDLLLQHGQYDVFHVNTLWNSGLLLRVAAKNKIPVRICHSHSTESSANENLVYKVYKAVMRRLILKEATAYVSCGQDAGEYLYGKKMFSKKGSIIYNGINIEDFRFNPRVRQQVREELNLHQNEMVLGHVGRIAPVKNHPFMIELLEQLVDDHPTMKLIFVGDGPDFTKIQEEVKRKHLEKNVIMLGSRKDVNKLLQAFDVLLFPSLFEGFPVSLVEAQASGLPCLISGNITDEAVLINNCVKISLSQPTKWLEIIKEKIEEQNERPHIAIHRIEEAFDSHYTAKKWEALYDQ